MSTINIAFGITQDWLEHTFVTMCSILSNAQKNNFYQFYILSNVSQKDFEKEFIPVCSILKNIHSDFDVNYIKMNDTHFNGVVHDKRVGISAYYRLKLSSLVETEKIIYLDSDIIVLDNITELWNYDIENYLIGGVEDKYSNLMTCQANLKDYDIYINSGVLLINLKKFREQDIENKIFKKLREENNNYSDQDVLNDICQKQILYLPLKYNLMLTRDDKRAYPTRQDEYKNALITPYILHYSIKPWIIPVQYSEYWRKYYEIIKTS